MDATKQAKEAEVASLQARIGELGGTLDQAFLAMWPIANYDRPFADRWLKYTSLPVASSSPANRS